MTKWPYPFWIAHRGAGELAPENTLAAFRLGALHGYRAFECDVKLSRDGVPFLLHDANLRRTTPRHESPAELDWSELSQLDAGSWHSANNAGEPLPTLANIATYCLHNDYAINLEIKPVPGHEKQTGHVVAQHALKLWAGKQLPPLISSFQVEALEAARQAAPSIPRALLLGALSHDGIQQALALACVAVVCNHKKLEDSAFALAKAANLRVLAYTVNEAAQIERLKALGIDGIITDAVDRFSPIS